MIFKVIANELNMCIENMVFSRCEKIYVEQSTYYINKVSLFLATMNNVSQKNLPVRVSFLF